MPPHCVSSASASCCSRSAYLQERAGGAAGAVPRPVGSSNIWENSESSGVGAAGAAGGAAGGAMGGAVGAADGAARVVAGSGRLTRPGTAVVVGAGGRHGAEAGTQAREPPRPLAGSGVNPTMYLAFCASGSAFQRRPGAWQS
eukprot:scaffold24244_cov63-Phaeocystis_antarctica.AAC.3